MHLMKTTTNSKPHTHYSCN